jgi:hypothetical protein
VDLRELDAAVHERVMGQPLKRGRLVAVVPRYSADLRAAFEVVERLRGEGRWLVLRGGTLPDGSPDWLAEFGQDDDAWFGRGATAARAIARAALATRED